MISKQQLSLENYSSVMNFRIVISEIGLIIRNLLEYFSDDEIAKIKEMILLLLIENKEGA